MTLGWIVWHMMLQLTNSAKQMSLFHFLWKRMQRHIFWYVWFKNFLPFTDMVQVVLDVESLYWLNEYRTTQIDLSSLSCQIPSIWLPPALLTLGSFAANFWHVTQCSQCDMPKESCKGDYVLSCSLLLRWSWWVMFLSSVPQSMLCSFFINHFLENFGVSTQPVTTTWDGLFQKISLCHKQGTEPKQPREPKTKLPVAHIVASLISNSVGFGFA